MKDKKKYYSDISIASELIRQFLLGINSFDIYTKDTKTKSAVERQLLIIGEAVTRISKLDDQDLKSAAQIIAFRNRMVHAYDGIDDAIVWVIIQKYLPELLTEINLKK